MSGRCRDLFPGPAELSAVNPDTVASTRQTCAPAPPSHLFIPRRLMSASPRPQSQDHFFERSMLRLPDVEHDLHHSSSRSGIFCRSNRPRPIRIIRALTAQTPPRRIGFAETSWHVDRGAIGLDEHHGANSGVVIRSPHTFESPRTMAEQAAIRSSDDLFA